MISHGLLFADKFVNIGEEYRENHSITLYLKEEQRGSVGTANLISIYFAGLSYYFRPADRGLQPCYAEIDSDRSPVRERPWAS